MVGSTLGTKSMNDRQLYWLVGFYEGEGSIGIYQQKCRSLYTRKKDGKRDPTIHSYPRLNINITQKERYILDKIRTWLHFGSVCEKSDGIHSWTCVCQDAIKFIKLIYPHLRSKYKKNQMKRVIERWGKERIYE
jgi:hypothetical protein